MGRAKLCRTCGTPKRIAAEHVWLPDGTIVQRKNPEHRMVFIETENIARTFSGVEELINMSIEHIIVEAKRRAAFDFISHSIPTPVRIVVKIAGVKLVARSISGLGLVMGYGAIRIVKLRRLPFRSAYVIMGIRRPYSLPLFCGDLAGSFEAVRGREIGISYEQTGPDDYEVTGHISRHPLELRDRLSTRRYSHKPGDIALEPCPGCGAPLMLAEYAWDLETGVIEHRERGRRMAVLGPAALDAIIHELQVELGETVNRVITEAQRRIVRTGFYGLDEITPLDLFRRQFAIRGLGNLSEIEWRENGLRIRLENSCIQPVLVGVMQGFFELATGGHATVEWSVSDDGDLVVEVSSAS